MGHIREKQQDDLKWSKGVRPTGTMGYLHISTADQQFADINITIGVYLFTGRLLVSSQFPSQ